MIRIKDKERMVQLVIPLLILIALPIIIYLVQHPQVLKPKAGGGALEFFGDNTVNLTNGGQGFTVDSQGKPTVGVRLTSPLGPPGVGNSSTSNNSGNTGGGSSTNNTQQSTTNSSPNSFQLSPSSGSESVGQSFDVTLYLNAGSNSVDSFDINISFDSSLLQIDSFSIGSTLTALTNNAPDNTNGSFRLAASDANNNPITGNTKVGVIHFKAKAAGSARVSVTPTQVISSGDRPTALSIAGTTASFQIQ